MTRKTVYSGASKIKKNVKIIRSSVAMFSSMSLESANLILRVLKRNFVKAEIVTVNNEEDLQKILVDKTDVAFLGVHYVTSKDKSKIWLSDFLEDNNIKYTGSSKKAHSLSINKARAKQAVVNAGLKTSPFVLLSNCDNAGELCEDLDFPMFIKPHDKGGGAGIDDNSVVWNDEDLRSKVNSLTEYNWTKSLIEQYLAGREFSVAVMKNESTGELQAMPIELVTNKNKDGVSMLGRNVKTANEESVLPVLNSEIRKQVSDLAIGVFQALGASDYGRIDIRMDSNGVPNFLEANLIPSLIEGYGSFPKACKINNQIEYEQMILGLVRLACA